MHKEQVPLAAEPSNRRLQVCALPLVLVSLALPGGGAQHLMLRVGEPISRQITPEEEHVYSVRLLSGQYLHVVVNQQDADIMLSLESSGKPRIPYVNDSGPYEPESLFYVSKATSVHTLRVRSWIPSSGRGVYQIRVEQLRTATIEDKRYAAAWLERQSMQLPRETLLLLEDELARVRAKGDRSLEAEAFLAIGQQMITVSLSSSIESFDRALLLSQIAGN
jgi:hypothetical protein